MFNTRTVQSSLDKRVVAVLLLLSIALGFAISYMWVLRVQLTDLSSELSELRTYQRGLKNQLDAVQESLSTVCMNETGLPVNYTFPVAAIFNRIEPSVVYIRVKGGVTGEIQGSGFVLDREGHIVTNNHVVENGAKIQVTFLDGTTVNANTVGTDPYSDLAVIKVDPAKLALKPLPLGNSSKIRVGDPVIAVGNPFGLAGTVTTGVVSQKGRILRTVGRFSTPSIIQIDASINPGNSGGPLLNFRGEVVGVTTAIESLTGIFSGVGFAVPSNTVARVTPSLIEEGEYHYSWMGVSGIDVSPEIVDAMDLNVTKGFLIVDVMEGSPADKAGLQGWSRQVTVDGKDLQIGGDVIIRLDGTVIRGLDDILVYLEEKTKPGDTVAATLIRGGVKVAVDVTVGERARP